MLQQSDNSQLSLNDTFTTYPVYVGRQDRSKMSVIVEEQHNLHAEDSNNDYTEGYAACSDRGCIAANSYEATHGATSGQSTSEGPRHAGVSPLMQPSENRLTELSTEGYDINYLGSGNPLGQEEYLFHVQHPNLSQLSQQLQYDEESSDGHPISGQLSSEDLPSAVCMQEHATHDVMSFLSELHSGVMYEPPSSDTHQFNDPLEQNVFKGDQFDLDAAVPLLGRPSEEDQVESRSLQDKEPLDA
ncbi:hypothetical protein BGZ58_006163 [Dissophora ornata]|nr:hypothetical protein BGZ58_006163 [Dissophora ornata]